MNTGAAEKFLAEHYGSIGTAENDFRNSNLVEWVVSRVLGDRVLDIGAGSGFLLSRLGKRGKQVVGLEPNERLLELAGRLHPEVTMLRGAAESLDSRLGSFSSVTLIDVLEHIEDDVAELRRIREVLDPGGRLIIVVPAHPFLYGARDRNQGHFRRYSKRRLLKVVADANLRVVEIRFWNVLGLGPYLLSEKVLRRPLDVSMRTSARKSPLQKAALFFLHKWFALVENRVNFGVGLSLMCVCERES